MEILPAESTFPVLTVRAHRHVCAVTLSHVTEVMRLLPVEPLDGAPAFVSGLTIIRGKATPVVDLNRLLGDVAMEPVKPTALTRLVTLQIGGRAIALLVDAVLTTRTLVRTEFTALPPLWQGPHSPAVAALGALDRELFLVLETTRLLPDDQGRFNGEGAA